MQVQFTSAGFPSWVAELDSLTEKEVLKEFRSRRPDLNDKKVEIVWVEPKYLGRIYEGMHIVGRFWQKEQDDQRAVPAMRGLA
jgi:hypothetical protein